MDVKENTVQRTENKIMWWYEHKERMEKTNGQNN
jgi:hypothetical protein